MNPRVLVPVLLLPALALPVALAVVGTSGCKQEAQGIDSGVDGGKEADQTTPAEQEQLCEAVVEYNASLYTEAELQRTACTALAIAFALAQDGSVMTCVTLRDGCLDAPPDDTTGGTSGGTGGMDTCTLGIDWANCTATVAELEACYEERAQQSKAASASLSCDKMAEYKTNPPSTDPPPAGEACSRAQAKCPSIAQ